MFDHVLSLKKVNNDYTFSKVLEEFDIITTKCKVFLIMTSVSVIAVLGSVPNEGQLLIVQWHIYFIL